MKKYVSILLVLLVVAALSVSGCTVLGGNNNGGQATPVPTATPGTTEPGATDAPVTEPTTTPGTSVSDTLGSLYSLGQLHSFEYRMTTSVEGESMVMNMKTEMLGQGVDPKDGKTKDHMKVTTTMDIPGMGSQTNSMDFYLDPEAEDSDDSSSGADYMTSDASLVNVGVETITVPAGTFTCTKYTVTEDGQTTTFWASPQAPLPVKYEGTSEGSTITTELVSWS
ncbi:hypothetical protein [Methanocella sp. MCL-LM]|uniref:hypothetical protein n=1 Tax=Methanocella sp. MCL-LM TaxID=3412035 RepID=UPI003C785399